MRTMTNILNHTPLTLDGETLADALYALDLAAFPEVADFALALRPSSDDGPHLLMTSAKYGQLASFPEWDHADRDLRHFIPQDVPVGSIDSPYADAGESWRLVLFELAGSVYVLEADAPTTMQFRSWFRVSRDRYLETWARLIQSFNPLVSLEEWIAAQNEPADA
jgi:hypothetical protein